MAEDRQIIFSMYKVSKTYPPQKQVIKDISLSFYLGAKIGIIGLNGSGKSTLLKIIAGLEKDFNGELAFSPGYTVGHLSQEPNYSRPAPGDRLNAKSISAYHCRVFAY